MQASAFSTVCGMPRLISVRLAAGATVAECCAGIGLVRLGLSLCGRDPNRCFALNGSASPYQNSGSQPAGEHAGLGAAAGRAHWLGVPPDGGGHELRGFRVDGDVAAEQHAADDLPGVPGRPEGRRSCQPSLLR